MNIISPVTDSFFSDSFSVVCTTIIIKTAESKLTQWRELCFLLMIVTLNREKDCLFVCYSSIPRV